MSATSKTGRAALVAASVGSRVPRDRDGRARRPAEPPQGDLSHAEAQRDRERRDMFWFGNAPEGWSVGKMRSVVYERREKFNRNEELIILSLLKDVGVIPYSEKGNIGNKSKDDHTQYKVARKGDLVINSMNVIIGSVGISPYDGYISPAYYSFAPRSDTCMGFIGYLCSTRKFQKAVRCYAKGIMEIRLRVSSYDFLSMPIPLPPLPEQKAIVAYLDAETGRINKAIAAEEKMIALLQERREIVINEAVGGGERRNGWKMVPVKRVCTMQAGKNLTSLEIQQTGEYPVYGANGQRGWYGKYNCEGDFLLVGRQGALCGNVHHVDGRFWATDHALITRTVEGVDISFAYYLFTAANFNQYASQTAAQPGLAAGQILNVKVPFPPLPEQKEIVKRLDAETGKIDRAIEVKRRQIELLRERRQIVIDEAVTGKVKVA